MLNIHYFQDGAEIKRENLDAVLLEIESLIKWITESVYGDDKEYLLVRLKNIKKIIGDSLQNEDDTLYIF